MSVTLLKDDHSEMNPGIAFRTLLKTKHIKPADFARQMNVGAQAVNNWFKRGIPANRIVDAALLLGVKDIAVFAKEYSSSPSDSPSPSEAAYQDEIRHKLTPHQNDLIDSVLADIEAIRSEFATPKDNPSELLLDAVLDTLQVGITIMKGPDLKYVKINQQLAEINGYPAAFHIGKPARDILVGEAGENIRAEIKKVYDTKESITREVALELNGSGRRSYKNSIIPVGDDYVISIVEDITKFEAISNLLAELKN